MILALVKYRTPQEDKLGNGSRKQKRVVPVISGIKEVESSGSHTIVRGGVNSLGRVVKCSP